tara:strand:- start:893 stop:2146 length:1254 start_codon:yes stop_codon:yes gene_type:complete
MATHDYVIANGTGSAVRSDLNNALAAIVSNNSSSTEPSTKYAYQFWADTNTSILKIRNSANSAWINLFTLAGGIDVDAASNFNEDVTFTGASANVTWDKSADDFIFNDNAKAVFGTSSDGLEVFHDGSNSWIKDTGTGVLAIAGSTTQIKNSTGAEACAKFMSNGAVELYFDNSLKCSTTSGGFSVTGDCAISGELNLLGDSDASKFLDARVGTNAFHIRKVTGGDAGHENMAAFRGDAGCEFYFDNALKLQTISTGCYVTGGIRLGTNNAANEMDDYEEGTFTATARDATSGGNATTTNANCFYTKVGRLVTIQVRLEDINKTGMTSTNEFYITGLPFTSANENGNRSTASCYVVDINPSSSSDIKEHLNGILAPNTSYIKFAWSRTEGESASTLKVADIEDDASDIEFTMTYTAT